MKKKTGTVFGRLAAVALTLVMIMGSLGVSRVYAGTPFPENVPSTQVNYRHNGGHSYEVQDPDWVQVYCLDPAKGYSDDKANQNIRWKIDFWANSWILNNNEQDVNGSAKPTPEQLNRLVSILWHAEKAGADIDTTQNAVWWFVTNGADDDYAGSPSSYNNDIVKAAGDSGWAMPASFSLYFYAADTEAFGFNTIQNMVRLEATQPETWTIRTKASAAGKGSAGEGAPLTIVLEEGQDSTGPLTVSDTIIYSGMTPGTTYEVQTKLMKVDEDGNATELRDRAGDGGYIGGFTAEAADGEWTGENLTFYNADLTPGKYVFFESVRNTATGWVVDHKNVNDLAQTILVKPAGDDKPDTPDTLADDRAPSMKTRVSVNGQTGNPLEISGEEALEVSEVVDTVDYSGLIVGAEYTVGGSLVKVEGGKYDINSPVSTCEMTFVADTAAGSCMLTFPVNGGLDPASTYVVIETLTSSDGKDDKIPAKGLVHPENISEDDEDAKAQMIKTGTVDAPITPQGNPEEEPAEPKNNSNNNTGGKSSGSKTNTSTGNAGDKVSGNSTSQASSPKTGDDNHAPFFLFALFASAAAAAVLIRKRRSV